MPAGQSGFQVFFQIGGEARPAVVATVHVDTALDLDEGFGFEMSEVGSPAAHGVEAEFLFQLRSTLRPPQQFKARFQPAWWLGPSEYSASAGGHP
ncbi:MAG: hypothetical protein RLZZ245_2274 [Verrucomicrobiota bacterium]